MPIHVVRQGEHISRLAEQYGLVLFDTIWNHSENADLKQKRENPNVLWPSDEVFIPAQKSKTVDAVTEKRHRYKLRGKPLKLRLVVQDTTGMPLANAKVRLQIDGYPLSLKADEHGLIEQAIPRSAENAVLILDDHDTPFTEPIKICIGHLDPIDTDSGWIARLNNLGYYAGSTEQLPLEASAEQRTARERLLRSAIEEFQCDHGLVVDGKCGPKTQKMLKDIYGC
jgi:hypothetical protein